MKKSILIILALLICIALTACTQEKEDAQASSSENAISETTKAETTTERVTSTTSPAFEDNENGLMLSDTVVDILSSDDDKASGKVIGDTKYGSFEYKLDKTNEADMYSQEQSEEMQKKAESNAQTLVDAISTYYPYKITFESTQAQQIGVSDNGIDSAVYVITYTNTQNQELSIRADSTGEIYYVYCNFTW